MRRPARGERGSAVVDFVLVLVVLVPLVLGIVQLALTMHVRNTLAAAAAEGARVAAARGATDADGAARTRDQISDAVSARYASDVSVRRTSAGGVATVEVVVRAEVPALGLGGPGVPLRVEGHATAEQPVGAP
ncbi:MAG: pilus assembly protein TadE [Nocardioides sp.]|nr:pilus assembly protein TadE [Nocardioides sp.]